MEDRNYIINRIRSRILTIDEFNYDRLEAPPISAMFTAQDIAQLNMIAKSIRYSARPEVKYREIDKIMRSRGFVKFIAGTNRIVYRPLEDTRFLVKVAGDAVGLGDNPREYKNQFIFKPFVTKVFEITPCGTLGVFERVNPITSREEFLSVASDIFEVINKWFVGEYVLEDIGTKFFMNWGIRAGFGPVLLDFPYVYKLDGNKLFCNAPSMSPSGCCEGEIDYDPGYNFLYCTKCGVKYKAKELAEAIKIKNIIVKSRGDKKMKVSVSGGSKNIKKKFETGEYAGMARTIKPSGISASASREKNNPVKKEKKEDDVKIYESSKEKKNNDEPVVQVVDQRNKIVEPVSFDESLIANDKAKQVEEYVDKIVHILDVASDDEKSTIIDLISKRLPVQYTEDLPKNENLSSSVEEYIEKASHCFDEIENTGTVAWDYSLFESLSNRFAAFLVSTLFEMGKATMSIEYNDLYYDVDENLTMVDLTSIIKNPEIDPIVINNDSMIGITNPVILKIAEEVKANDNTIESDPDAVGGANDQYGPCKYFAGKVINVKDLFADQQSGKIVVLINDNGKYLTTGSENNVVAIDMLDNRSIDSLSIVSAQWLNGVLESKETADEEGSESEDTTEESDVESGIPTGVLPPAADVVSVNGVATE